MVCFCFTIHVEAVDIFPVLSLFIGCGASIFRVLYWYITDHLPCVFMLCWFCYTVDLHTCIHVHFNINWSKLLIISLNSGCFFLKYIEIFFRHYFTKIHIHFKNIFSVTTRVVSTFSFKLRKSKRFLHV